MTTPGSTLRRLRLAAQRIEGSEFTTPTEVVTWMLALQGQDLPGAKWSVGLRAPGTTLADVDAALARGEIIRSWPMRGTLHLVPAVDIGWMLQLTGERTLRSLATRHRELGLDDATFGQARDIATKVLEGGRSATRAELFQAFEGAGIVTAGQRGPH
ncbi:MAG: DNA glycosylase AlkZ-like family protein, partial [Mycobacterium sp.]